MTGPDQSGCVLVSAGCTTGWIDWIHGELWVCPDGILRRALGLAATLKHGVGPTVRAEARPTRSIPSDELTRILAASRRNLWIPWNSVERAELRMQRLDIRLTGGGRRTLMWPPVDSNELLRERLSTALGTRLAIA